MFPNSMPEISEINWSQFFCHHTNLVYHWAAYALKMFHRVYPDSVYASEQPKAAEATLFYFHWSSYTVVKKIVDWRGSFEIISRWFYKWFARKKMWYKNKIIEIEIESTMVHLKVRTMLRHFWNPMVANAYHQANTR